VRRNGGCIVITPDVISWQWNDYDRAHRSRSNLVLHAVTNPLFVVGVLSALAFGPFRPWLALAGVVAAALAIAAQGRGHAREVNAPHPFRSPLDAVVRIFVEQFVTFPRFVFSGRFAAAWRASGGVPSGA